MLYFLTSYKQKFKKIKPIVKTIYKWTPTFHDKIRDCIKKQIGKFYMMSILTLILIQLYYCLFELFCIDTCL